ncbi:hypothetical protein J19TS2_18160 [Cohnella xylanilytica]|uniref:hypothetical protein n=1 Tax=Cohnella xylanilytica TaxID=557555 RepID=UPI001B0C81E8|nr:hypothetical protein [Cohnella xylanilytica]GIO12261.1 hypothetical protein J19TS2_18160 [Cohnella xylanilytica]
MKWKRMKPWKKWAISIAVILLILILAISCYFYYRVKTVDLDAIIAKHKKDPEQSVAAEVPSKTAVPNLLDKSLEKAGSLTDKPINTDDALDVAAILMSSGLSMKEISYLTGKSTENLTNEEKQKIRDLLLEKLTSKEIEALRSITSQYGKYLVIVDPNYPIELVGVYDEEERAKIIKELEEKRIASQPSGTKTPPPTPATSPSPSTPIQTPEPSATSDQAEAKQKIDAKYDMKFATLQTNCQSEVVALTDKVIDYIRQMKAEGKEVTISDLQENFLTDIASAEAKCDQQFDAILKNVQQEYKAAGLDTTGLNAYKDRYQQSKNKARSSALSKIIAVYRSDSTKK